MFCYLANKAVDEKEELVKMAACRRRENKSYLVIPKSASLTTLDELTRQFRHAMSLCTYLSSFR
jgi:hypothetical protein